MMKKKNNLTHCAHLDILFTISLMSYNIDYKNGNFYCMQRSRPFVITSTRYLNDYKQIELFFLINH